VVGSKHDMGLTGSHPIEAIEIPLAQYGRRRDFNESGGKNS